MYSHQYITSQLDSERRCEKGYVGISEVGMVRRVSSEKKKKAEELISRYRAPKSKAKVTPAVDLSQQMSDYSTVPRTAWNPAWPRNRLCELCGCQVGKEDRAECYYCNVVAHIECVGLKIRPKKWTCGDCRRADEIARRERIIETAEHQLKLKRHVNSVAIQARVRSFIRNQPFVKLKKSVVAIQGAVRYLGARRQFRLEHGNEKRPYFIKVSRITGFSSSSRRRQFFCLVTVVENATGEDEEEGRKTLYQFQTSVAKGLSSEGPLDFSQDVFLVPSTACGVTAVVTVLSREDDHGSVFFQGQADWNLEQDLLYFRKGRRSLNCSTVFNDDTFEPRERVGSSQSFRMMLRGEDDGEKDAVVAKVHLDPCPVASTHHGPLDEMTSVFSRKAVKRRWWALLVDRVLYFYKNHDDQVAQFNIHLNKSQLKFHHHTAMLEITSPQIHGVILLSHTDAKARIKWFKKLRR